MLRDMKDASPPVSVPRIATPRLLLREFRMSDFEAFAENLADPVATEHLSGVADRRAALRIFAAQMGFWMLQGAGWWGIELKETGELVGTVGAFFREPGASPCSLRSPPDLELGWVLYRRFWRQGFATEAAAAALAFSVEAHKPSRVIAHISPGNVASIGVSRQLGMHYETDTELHDTVVGRYLIEPS